MSECQIHYDGITVEGSLRELTDVTIKKLHINKSIRENLGGENLHYSQSKNIPEKLDKKYFVHPECYKKFIYAETLQKKRKQEGENRTSKRLKTNQNDETENILFPNLCMFCKNVSKTVNSKKQLAKTILTRNAESNIKEAAAKCNDEKMLTEIRGKDLIAREFKTHDVCYRDYTRILYEKEPQENQSKYDKGDYEKVCSLIEEQVIQANVCVSMKLIMDNYGIGQGQHQYRSNLKNRLIKTFGDKIIFVTPENNTQQVIISRSCLIGKPVMTTIEVSNENIVKKAALLIRHSAKESIDNSKDPSWPPTYDELANESRESPKIMQQFYQYLLEGDWRGSHHETSEKNKRLNKSFCSDVMFALSNGNFLTSKHCAVGLGLHSLTGLKQPITLLSKLGHSISYKQVEEIETAQAELALTLSNDSSILPLVPRNSGDKVPTIFWWDNLDKNLDAKIGGGSIHITPGIVFQEDVPGSKQRKQVTLQKKSKRLSIDLPQASNADEYPTHINSKKNPARFNVSVQPAQSDSLKMFQVLLSMWNILRYNSIDKTEYCNFRGFTVKLFSEKRTGTILTYLPPIQTPITAYATLCEIFKKSLNLAKQANMKYAHVTLDVGAAIKAYHIVWNYPEKWKNVIIHLGDFHGFLAFFGIIGKYIKCSGFEEVVYQANLCTPGSLNAVLTGKHYNRCWWVHENFCEALERLFIKTYLPEYENVTANIELVDTNEGLMKAANTNAVSQLLEKYNELKLQGLKGELGATVQFWLIYMDMIETMYQLQFAIYTNNFPLKLMAWEKFLPLCYVMNKVHYARYGTYYIQHLRQLEESHPGSMEEVESFMSVRRNQIGIGQAVDLAGEQTYMRNAKTAGGITMFANNPQTVLKWTLNRPYQSKFLEGLAEISGCSRSVSDQRKMLRQKK